MVDQS